jgi:alcohol dehydrogenase class IV
MRRPDADAAGALVEALVALNADLAVPRLRDLGIERDHFDSVKRAMAEAALASGSPGFNPRVPDVSEIVSLYEGVYA